MKFRPVGHAWRVEAYFSNYIEGTEFTLDEASDIVFNGVVPDQRRADAHDILGTHELTNSDTEMRRTPKTGDEYIGLLRSRHAVIMTGRPDKGPGQFKDRANRAGNTEFVDPAMVEGTLRRGFDIGAGLISPFARATYMMFLTSEVHPFADGNGRTARIMMNAELATASEVRIIIPTVYRLNYLAALKAATHGNNFAALLATFVLRAALDRQSRLHEQEHRRSRLRANPRAPRREGGGRRRHSAHHAVTRGVSPNKDTPS